MSALRQLDQRKHWWRVFVVSRWGSLKPLQDAHEAHVVPSTILAEGETPLEA